MLGNKQNLLIRYVVICAIAFVALIAVIGKIIYIQTKERDRWLTEAAKQKKTDVEVAPNRGNIYAADGRLMASSFPTYTLAIDPCTDWYMKDTSKNFNKYIDTIAYIFSNVIGEHSADEYKNDITKAHNRGIRTMTVNKTAISYSQKKKIFESKPFSYGRNKGGLSFTEHKKRKQPFGSLARRTLGNVNTFSDPKSAILEGEGNSGLELYYNELLKGTPGRSIRQRVATKDENEIIEPAIDGCDIYTTLDIDLLDITEYALRKQLEYSEASWGCAVLMETHSGDIKAISNLKRDEHGRYYESVNYAAQAFEPGSTFKTFSLMAALDDNLIKLTDSIKTGNGTWIYKDQKNPIHDAHPSGTITAKQALTVSSNVALAKIITSGYKENTKKYVAKLERMGFTEPMTIAIPGAHNVNITAPEDKESLAHMAFGYSVTIPPIYTLAYYNAIANNGVLIEPKLVSEIRQGNKVVEEFPTKVLKNGICKSSTLSEIRECLESVVWDKNGTARAAQSDTVRIAGKTGTARVVVNGKYIDAHRVTFCGFFPYENPRYTCICVIERPKRGGAGSLCGKAVRDIAEHTMAIKGTVPIDVVSVSRDSIEKPEVKAGNITATRKGINHVALKLNNYSDSTDWGKVDKDLYISNINVSPYFMPDVIGMGAKDAIYAIEQTGMKVRISGSGKVVKQSLAAGRPVQPGGIIYIDLR